MAWRRHEREDFAASLRQHAPSFVFFGSAGTPFKSRSNPSVIAEEDDGPTELFASSYSYLGSLHHHWPSSVSSLLFRNGTDMAAAAREQSLIENELSLLESYLGDFSSLCSARRRRRLLLLQKTA